MVNSILKTATIEWLLEKNNPSVRYYTLLNLLGESEESAEVEKTRNNIMESKVVSSILNNQSTRGYWIHEKDMYLPKYIATTHQLLILTELGASKNKEIERAIEHVYQFQRTSGHFLTELPKTEKGKNSTVFDGCCIDGNILYYLIHFGYLEDPRTENLLNFIYNYYDSGNRGWKCRAYPINPQAVFPIHCYMGATKILKAFSTIHKVYSINKINQIISRESEKILENQVFKYLKNLDGSRKDKAGWKRFGFPLFYQADALEVMLTLTRLGIHDKRMIDSIKLIEDTQQKDGTWTLKNSFNGKMWIDIEVKNKPSKWITLRALTVLKNWYQL